MMDAVSRFFPTRNGVLFVENCSLPQIAERFGTPCYIYSQQALQTALSEFQQILASHPAGRKARICYAVKANSNLAILKLFAEMGAGFDIVSGGELERVQVAAGTAGQVIFSGVGKTGAEISRALKAGIFCFNVESISELERIDEIAASLGKQAPISLRVNPDVDAGTHRYISTGLKDNKFGIAWSQAFALYQHAAKLPHLKVIGISCHIGSQLLDPAPVFAALDKLIELVSRLASAEIPLQYLNLGGGLGIQYHPDEREPTASEYLIPILDRLAGCHDDLELIIEPGRRLVGNAGILITRVEYLKTGENKNFAIVDAAMNDLIRSSLYDAWHNIVAVQDRSAQTESSLYDIVGPVCESSDFLGLNRRLALQEGDLLAICSAGAYGMTMSSNYNTRPRAAEVLVDADQMRLIRRRETFADLIAVENL